jgi:hypothetical protein
MTRAQLDLGAYRCPACSAWADADAGCPNAGDLAHRQTHLDTLAELGFTDAAGERHGKEVQERT